jgi:RNase H-fold protein (predicted Holliday junction resolvase)
MKIISLSVCNNKIGVAAVETTATSIESLTNVRIAIPLGTLEINGSELQKITNIMRLLKTNIVVIGLPRGGGERVRYVRGFAELLIALETDVRFQDENLSSVLAKKSLKRGKEKYTEADVRKTAAALILQDFIDGVGESQVEVQPQFQLETESQSLLSDGLELETTPAVEEQPVAAEAVPITPQKVFVPKRIDIVNVN